MSQGIATLRSVAHHFISQQMGADMLAESLAAIRVIRPGMTLYPRAIVEAILLSEGSIGSAQLVAQLLGFRNRFQLARLLKREGLPPLHRLAAWTTILSWVRAAERDSTCLFRLAYRSHRHPAACYRLVKEVTGLSWTEVRRRGSAWVERRLIMEFRKTVDLTRPRPGAPVVTCRPKMLMSSRAYRSSETHGSRARQNSRRAL